MATGRGARKSIYSAGYEKVLDLLRETRLDAGLTQAQLCERLGRPRNYVSKCESGERRVDVLEWAEFMAGCEADPVTFLVRLAREGVIQPPLQVSTPTQKKPNRSTGRQKDSPTGSH